VPSHARAVIPGISLALLVLFLAACAMAKPTSQSILATISRELAATPTAAYTLVPTFTRTPDRPSVPSPKLASTVLVPTVTSTPMPVPSPESTSIALVPAVTSTPMLTHTATCTLVPTSTSTPTLAEMNRRYGPCADVPVLIYHHVQSYEQALAEGNEAFTITTVRFRQQMTYLVRQGYTTIRMQDLNAFFDEGQTLPSRPVLLTFDDGYDDFASDALPVLEELGMQATVFLPVGLVGQSGHLTWEQIGHIASEGTGGTEILFANHTWSHTNVGYGREAASREISTADAELVGRGLNQPRTFCYPYGLASSYAQEVLADMEYGLGFTADPGSILCRGQRLALPRIHVGAGPLETYGL
jgi:peptidoglycan/xylan/chitin deacetylase (PgdA/CDA1 family)